MNSPHLPLYQVLYVGIVYKLILLQGELVFQTFSSLRIYCTALHASVFMYNLSCQIIIFKLNILLVCFVSKIFGA